MTDDDQFANLQFAIHNSKCRNATSGFAIRGVTLGRVAFSYYLVSLTDGTQLFLTDEDKLVNLRLAHHNSDFRDARDG